MKRRETLRAALALALSMAWCLSCALAPRPLSDAQLRERSQRDLAALFGSMGTAEETQEDPDARLDLYTAMALAARHNLDQQVSRLETALAEGKLDQARLGLLPRLVASSEYYGRNNEHGAVSQSLLTGLESLEPSTSQERHGFRSDLTLAWNVLDFGISWVHAAQEADQSLIARERREKALQDLLLDVRRSYWRAAGAERLIPEVEALGNEVATALASSRELEEERLLDPRAALDYRRSLLERLRELRDLRRELETSQVELARLVGARPGASLRLDAPALDALPMPIVDLPVAHLEEQALVARPELREADYRERIGRLEVRRAMLSMLPGVQLRVGRNHDTNDFLFNSDWWSYSALLSQNLMELVQGPGEVKLARAGVDVVQARRLATSVAVLAQVQVAYQEYVAAHETLRVAGELRDVEGRLHEVAHEMVQAAREAELELIRKRADRTVAELRHWMAYANLQASYGRLLNSVGVRAEIEDGVMQTTPELARAIRGAFDGFRRRLEIARDHPGAQIPVPARLGGEG